MLPFSFAITLAVASGIDPWHHLLPCAILKSHLPLCDVTFSMPLPTCISGSMLFILWPQELNRSVFDLLRQLSIWSSGFVLSSKSLIPLISWIRLLRTQVCIL